MIPFHLVVVITPEEPDPPEAMASYSKVFLYPYVQVLVVTLAQSVRSLITPCNVIDPPGLK